MLGQDTLSRGLVIKVVDLGPVLARAPRLAHVSAQRDGVVPWRFYMTPRLSPCSKGEDTLSTGSAAMKHTGLPGLGSGLSVLALAITLWSCAIETKDTRMSWNEYILCGKTSQYSSLYRTSNVDVVSLVIPPSMYTTQTVVILNLVAGLAVLLRGS